MGDLAPEELGTYLDDVSGEVLPPGLTHEARVEEIKFMQDWRVWGVRPVSECRAMAGQAPIWVSVGGPQQGAARYPRSGVGGWRGS